METTLDITKVIAVFFSGAILLVVVELIRRNHLKERYSLIWLGAALVLLLFSASRELLHAIARLVGIHYPPSFLFLLAIGFLLLLLLHFSMFISKLSDKNKRLAQELGLLRSKIWELEKKSNSKSSGEK